MLTGQNGILKRAKESERNTNKESLREQIQLELMDTYDEDGYDTEKLKEKLKEDYNVDDILDTEEGGFAFPLDGYIVKVEKNEKGVPKVEIEGDGNRENLPTPPTLLGSDTKIDFDPNDWTNTGVKVTITLDEKIDKGGSVLQYSIDEGQTWNTYRNPFEIVENNTVIIARLYNGVNESSGYATATVTKIDKIEPTAPNVEIGTGAVLGNEDWYRSEVTIKITEGTDYESGVEKTTYVITGAQETAETEGKEVKITKEGKSYITAYT